MYKKFDKPYIVMKKSLVTSFKKGNSNSYIKFLGTFVFKAQKNQIEMFKSFEYLL